MFAEKKRVCVYVLCTKFHPYHQLVQLPEFPMHNSDVTDVLLSSDDIQIMETDSMPSVPDLLNTFRTYLRGDLCIGTFIQSFLKPQRQIRLIWCIVDLRMTHTSLRAVLWIQ